MHPVLPALLALLAPSALAIDLQTLVNQYNATAASYSFAMPETAEDSQTAANYVKKSWSLNGGIDWGGSDIVFSPDPLANNGSSSSSSVASASASPAASDSAAASSATLQRRQSLTVFTQQGTATAAVTAASSISSAVGGGASSASSKSSGSGSSTSKSKTSGGSGSGSTSTQTSISYPASTDLAGMAPALRVTYPAGSYSKRTGGTQFYAQPLVNEAYERMILSYDIWFPANYSFVQGGKLPGMRGGPDRSGCSGGSQTDGTTCFSTRLMWRPNGTGEVYAYIPTSSTGLCTQSNVICNSDFGTSLGRGTFTFQTGQWQTIYLVVVLNKVGTANGIVELYYNGVKAVSFQNMVLRTASSLSSVGGLFFSTFFGGDDSSWATPTEQYVYWRNMQLFAGRGASTLSGNAVSSSGSGSSSAGEAVVVRSFGAGWAVAFLTALVGLIGLF